MYNVGEEEGAVQRGTCFAGSVKRGKRVTVGERRKRKGEAEHMEKKVNTELERRRALLSQNGKKGMGKDTIVCRLPSKRGV